MKGVMTSQGHVTSSVMSPFESPRPLSYRLAIVTFLLAPLVFEIFDLKVADTHTHTHTYIQNSTLSDNKGPLKLSAREPINTEVLKLKSNRMMAAYLLLRLAVGL